MFSPSHLNALASGQRRGVAPALFRATTRLLEFPVAWYVRRRNHGYDSGRLKTTRAAMPVISVGNLTVGGTGKTPMVEWIARWLQSRGKSVVLISRGYGAKSGQTNDEARELAEKLPDVPHIQNPDRVAAAAQACQQYPGSVLLLDDAFQHRRLHRDLDIVLLDALAPFGYDHLLPRGLLREPVESLARAHVVVLSRANLVEPRVRASIHERVKWIASQAAWVEASHQPQALIGLRNESEPVSLLQGKSIAAFCGIGNPAGFRRTLEAAGAVIAHWKELPDHYRYLPAEFAKLEAWIRSASGIELIVCTHKDLVKLPIGQLAGIPVRALSIGIAISEGEALLQQRLERFR